MQLDQQKLQSLYFEVFDPGVSSLALPSIQHVVDEERFVKVPVASVRLVTYNHVLWVKDALESILEQDFEEPYEITIVDDGSTDGTQAILRDYQRRYPEQIHLYLAESNTHFQIHQYVDVNALRGEYCFYIEGDDYWCDKTRMREQIQCLRKADADVCFAKTLEVDSKKVPLGRIFGDVEKFDPSMCVGRKFPHMTSWCFRKTAMVELVRRWPTIVRHYDAHMAILMVMYYECIVWPKVVSCYRQTGAGIWTSQSGFLQSWLVLSQLWACYAWYPPQRIPSSVHVELRKVFKNLLNYSIKESYLSKEERNRLLKLKVLWQSYCPWWRMIRRWKFHRRLARCLAKPTREEC